MSILQHASAIRTDGSVLSATLDAEWSIWGPVGGYVAAIAMRAAGTAVPEGHRPVSFSCQFLNKGNEGPIEIFAETLRPGSSACIAVRLVQNEKIILNAQVWTTSKTDGPEQIDVTAPDVPAPAALESFVNQLRKNGHEPIPFWVNLDGRQVDFRSPGVPDPRGCRTERWLRYRDWEPTNDLFLEAARSLIAIDTHIWPAHNRGLTASPNYVAPSLDLTVWFHKAAPQAEWLLAEGRSDMTSQALLSGTVRVWAEDGTLVASGGSQCLVVPMRGPS